MVSPCNLPTIDKSRSRASFLSVTLGCAKNEVDSDRMRALLFQAGFSEVDTVHEADVILINTCSFLVSATEESIEVTLSLAEQVAEGVRERPIIMCGCMPSRYGEALHTELTEVAAFVRADEEDGIVSVVEQVLGLEQEPEYSTSRALALRTVQGTSAFVKISDGCNRRCSFCAIPAIRGAYYSRSAEEICAEVEGLLTGGVREIILIGQDTGVWGCDLPGRPSLASLCKQVAEKVRPYGGWVRVLYLQPEGITEELIEAIRDTPEILPYLDIPIQHSNKRILRRMHRAGSTEELASLFARLRSQIDGMVLRSTAMAGFPGESDEEADELVDFLDEQALDYCSVFSYSAEEGTEAAKMDGQLDDETKLERTQRLQDIAEKHGFAATASHVGEIVQVIIDGAEEGPEGPELIGHAWFQAPDSDGVVHIAEGEASVGELVSVRLIDSFCYELIGEIVAEGEEC